MYKQDKITDNEIIICQREASINMSLKSADKSFYYEECGKFVLQNSNFEALQRFQKALDGAAQHAGLNSPDDVEKYIKEMRTLKKN
ncbi:MAG: AbrB/MazE/SpoVT family DNA-binding domain-containing protein [Candidatus Cloacimonetes bacterium]|nr:AbrB/MazE/SpoVT family DNA-binding domain-containing protein [Candidatus Cloacimonadota bacterium]